MSFDLISSAMSLPLSDIMNVVQSQPYMLLWELNQSTGQIYSMYRAVLNQEYRQTLARPLRITETVTGYQYIFSTVSQE